MSRQRKRGVDYFPFDVDFFEDRKIKELRGKYGADGVTLYLYLLCQIYKDNGYYLQLDDGYDYVISADMGMDSEKIGMIVNFLCKRSLFNDKLFTSDKVLTSHGIQMRFQECVKTRAQKTEVAVNKGFWILKKEETKGYIKVTHFEDFSEKKEDFSEKKEDFSIEKRHKVKESKVNININNKEYIGTGTPSARTRFKKPSAEDISAYCRERNNGVDPQRFFDYYEANGWKVGKNPMKDWRAAVRTWEKNGIDIKTQKAKTTGYDQRQYTDEELERVFERWEDAND